ncbi:long-chain acyl-CoA synthetase [Micromonospora pattaloongensis]|uniref:Long-chain acyl-CoA synthetase n=1 Tax=Micromonospora pattaloongensis TaxID=405436 RepID=A0A1H3GVH3_9ACTN|nr:AMP-binding protein [Micromonospora pattaloongensis]SDY06339.1 long-chain acyl-CoA synthetase [Micromonospora pattaloongensis]
MQEPPTAADFDAFAGNLAERVRRAAATGAHRPALIWRDRTVTWGELDARVDEVAHALGQLAPPGAAPAPRIAIALPNSPDLAVAFFATLRAGLVAVPVNPELTARELRHVLADSGAAQLICTEQVRDAVAGLRAELPGLHAVHTELPTLPGGPPRPAAVTDVADLAVLLYTSGTEGWPKGAMLSHRALLANHAQLAGLRPPVVGRDDRLLLALPLFHAYGLNTGLGAVAYHGACGVLIDRFDPVETMAAVVRHQVTVVIGVPSMFTAWSTLPSSPPGPLRFAVSGAAPLEPASALRFAELTGAPVHVGYGLTETAPVLTSTLAAPRVKPGSIGRPIPGVELRLVAADGELLWRDGAAGAQPEEEGWDLDVASDGTDPGEIVVRGPNLFSGYWPDGRGGPDAEGWWATGDVGYADADGDLFLVDRLGELILVNGFNVYPREIEQVLRSHPGVAEAAAIGVPDPRTGQAVKVYVVRTPGSEVDAAELSRHCAHNLARFKCPSSVEFVDTLPHSAIGKVRKKLLGSAPSAGTGAARAEEGGAGE